MNGPWPMQRDDWLFERFKNRPPPRRLQTLPKFGDAIVASSPTVLYGLVEMFQRNAHPLDNVHAITTAAKSKDEDFFHELELELKKVRTPNRLRFFLLACWENIPPGESKPLRMMTDAQRTDCAQRCLKKSSITLDAVKKERQRLGL